MFRKSNSDRRKRPGNLLNKHTVLRFAPLEAVWCAWGATASCSWLGCTWSSCSWRGWTWSSWSWSGCTWSRRSVAGRARADVRIGRRQRRLQEVMATKTAETKHCFYQKLLLAKTVAHLWLWQCSSRSVRSVLNVQILAYLACMHASKKWGAIMNPGAATF